MLAGRFLEKKLNRAPPSNAKKDFSRLIPDFYKSIASMRLTKV